MNLKNALAIFFAGGATKIFPFFTKGTLKMANYLIMAALVVVVALALKSSLKHFRGGGGCCGSGDVPVKATKKDIASPVAEKILIIGGMSCSNCAARVQNALNALDGVAAEVSLEKKSARVRLSRSVPDDVLRAAVARAGYEVISVKDA